MLNFRDSGPPDRLPGAARDPARVSVDRPPPRLGARRRPPARHAAQRARAARRSALARPRAAAFVPEVPSRGNSSPSTFEAHLTRPMLKYRGASLHERPLRPLRLPLPRGLPRSARRHHLVLRPQLLPRLSRSLHRLPRQSRRRASRSPRNSSPASATTPPATASASSFTFDDDAKTFLEREAGLEQRQPHHGHAASASGAGRTAGSARCRRRSSASTSRRAARSPASSHEIAEDAARPDATAGRGARPRRGLPPHAHAARPRRARIRRGVRGRPPAPHRPHLHLEGARLQPPRRHLPRRSHRARQRGRRLSRVPQGPRAVDAATTSACARRTKPRPPSTLVCHDRAHRRPGGRHRDARARPRHPLAARRDGRRHRHGALVPVAPQPDAAPGVRLSDHRFLRQLHAAPVAQRRCSARSARAACSSS